MNTQWLNAIQIDDVDFAYIDPINYTNLFVKMSFIIYRTCPQPLTLQKIETNYLFSINKNGRIYCHYRKFHYKHSIY